MNRPTPVIQIAWEQFRATYDLTTAWKVVEKAPNRFTRGKNLRVICTLAQASQAKHAIEIGTAAGHTAVALALTLPDAKVTTIGTTVALAGATKDGDGTIIYDDEHEGSFIREQVPAVQDRIKSISLKPESRRSLLSQVDIEPFQFAFIDGEHTWQCVAEDTREVLRGIDHNGIIVWDDFAYFQEIFFFIQTLQHRSNGRICSTKETNMAWVELDELTHAALTKAIKLL